MLPKAIVLAGLLLSTLFGFSTAAQQKTTQDGAFTVTQAQTGAEVYARACAACHDMKLYRDIWPAWEGRTVENFWFFLLGEMPSDNPGSLLDDEYTNVVAFILSDLGFPAGDVALDPNNGMNQIRIVAP